MKVILTESIAGLGRPGETVEVAGGYARNFLLPRGLAQPATKANIKEWDSKKGKIDKILAVERSGAEEVAKAIAAVQVKLTAKSGEEGKLFGSVTSAHIADALLEQHSIEVDKRKVQLGEAIKSVGEFDVRVDLHPDVSGAIKVVVEAEDAGEPTRIKDEPEATEEASADSADA